MLKSTLSFLKGALSRVSQRTLILHTSSKVEPKQKPQGQPSATRRDTPTKRPSHTTITAKDALYLLRMKELNK
jgi:hypothetical protein